MRQKNFLVFVVTQNMDLMFMKKSLIFRRSIYVIKNINQGDKFSRDNIAIIRPGKEIQPKFIDSIIGKKKCFYQREQRSNGNILNRKKVYEILC